MMRYALSSHHPPAAENEATEGEAKPKCAKREGADRDSFAPDREPLPVTECRRLLLGQLLPAPLLAHRTSGLEPQIEVVENLRRLL
jgi:hypothetical protein